MKVRKFSSALLFLVAFWVLAEVALGFIRNPIDDTFTGSVAIINGSKASPVDATMTLDMLEKGFTINKRPGIDNSGARLTFDGKDVPTLNAIGIQKNFVESEGRWQYQEGFCELMAVKTDPMSNGLNPENLHTQRGVLTFTSRGQGCMAFNVAITDFDHIEFSTYQRGYSFERKNVVYASLERDSRLSFIQRTIMRMRFDSWVSNNPVFATLSSR